MVVALIATGVWNGQGERVEPEHPDGGEARAAGVRLPAWVAVGGGDEIENETGVQLGVHGFTAEYAEQVSGFFDRYVP